MSVIAVLAVWWATRPEPKAVQRFDSVMAEKPAFDSSMRADEKVVETNVRTAHRHADNADRLIATVDSLTAPRHDSLGAETQLTVQGSLCDCVPRVAFDTLMAAYNERTAETVALRIALAYARSENMDYADRLARVELAASDMRTLAVAHSGIVSQAAERCGIVGGARLTGGFVGVGCVGVSVADVGRGAKKLVRTMFR